MSTQQQIDDPGQWRVGDDVTVVWNDGATLTARVTAHVTGSLFAGPVCIRVGWLDASTNDGNPAITVTRTVEPIPEPTVRWVLVRFADGAVMVRWADNHPEGWMDDEGSAWPWVDAVREHGAPAAVSLPRWSDEADGLRARVEAFIAELDRDGFEILNASHEAHRLRALLAEGGEA